MESESRFLWELAADILLSASNKETVFLCIYKHDCDTAEDWSRGPEVEMIWDWFVLVYNCILLTKTEFPVQTVSHKMFPQC